ncbi:MAG: 3-phosphoshikimate 1-carboxyvinyltransferase [Deltaproteobacteria bacterium]|nr:3-phosphoshikimate 1-carboxyvinyltransferase [Deltaproteobacteria bacterium]
MAETPSKKVSPTKGLRGEITVPGDKSISHRAVIFGSIADGRTEINGFLEGEDNLATVSAFRKMGVEIRRPSGGRLVIKGVGLDGLKEPDDVIDCANSGTTARLLAGLLSAQRFFSVITGDESLRKRPMKRLTLPLGKMGADITGRRGGAFLPLAISGKGLSGIRYGMEIASAQVKSSLLLAGLYAKGSTIITEPEKSRDHTERMLRRFAAPVRSDGNTVEIKKARSLKGCRMEVPGDISSAAFFMVAAVITPSSEILIKVVGTNPTRCGIIDILRKMGAAIELINVEDNDEPTADIVVRSSRLKGVSVSGAELLSAIDEFPILCVAAAFADGMTSIRGAGELRVKESDRIAVMAGSLKKIGVRVKELKDGIIIEGAGSAGWMAGKAGRVGGGIIESRGDHRIAMSMAVAGLASKRGVEIKGAGCVDVSYPGFFKYIDEVRLD